MNKKILAGCFTASLSVHILALCFFQSYSLWFASLPKRCFAQAAIEKKERDEILKESFRAAEIKSAPKTPQKEFLAETLATPPTVPLLCTFLAPLSEKSLIEHPHQIHFSMPELHRADLSSLSKDLILPKAESKPAAPFPKTNESPMQVSAQTILAHIPFSTETIPSEKNMIPAPIPNPPHFNALPKIPTLEELETASYSDAFDVELVFTPHGDKYLFALTLLPKEDLKIPKIRQHFTFLIDRSNSIQQERLSCTKSAVFKAIEELDPDDTFNIIAFDNKIEKFAPIPVSSTPEHLANAAQFLERIQLGSFFSSGDPTKSLFLTVPGMVKDNEIHTAILFTDGETFSKKDFQRSILHDWTLYNGGKVTLFSVGMDSDSQSGLLDVAAVFNKGKTLCSNSKKALKRKLMKLMKMIATPVAKNLHCKAISRSDAKITLYPKDGMAPHLYLNQPYILIGETTSLDDFVVFVQGRFNNKWLNIRKTVSFLNAKKGGKSLESEWAQHQAFSFYEKYIGDNNLKHLSDARALLEPLNMEVYLK